LDLESAQLELEAAEASKRAVDAKRRAAAALRADGLVRIAKKADDVPVDDQIRVKHPLAEEKVASPTLRHPWDYEPNNFYTKPSSDMVGFKIDKLLFIFTPR
uniref:SKIP_SNW domain-containing protein n=1 Tax=Echinostoma caproni TaxID=27848 RepID=A0A183A0J1_9TREM